MQLQLATRKKAKVKMALQGPSGAGKTYSALLFSLRTLPKEDQKEIMPLL